MITAERVREILDYDPSTGIFRWRVRMCNCVHIGMIAGGMTKQGYLRIRIGKQLYMAHRLAWFYIHGRWPAENLDHRDGQRANNALANLREATRRQNQYNKVPFSKTGVKGVHKQGKRYRVSIRNRDGSHRHLGMFDSLDDAAAAYRAAAALIHGEFALEQRPL